MALFQHASILLPYTTRFAPFEFDLLLLQGSRFNSDYWIPVLETWEEGGGGRVVTLDWPPSGLASAEQTDAFVHFVRTLGLARLRVVACDDACAMIEEIERDYPGVLERTLLFPRSAPRGEELRQAVDDFCGA